MRMCPRHSLCCDRMILSSRYLTVYISSRQSLFGPLWPSLWSDELLCHRTSPSQKSLWILSSLSLQCRYHPHQPLPLSCKVILWACPLPNFSTWIAQKISSFQRIPWHWCALSSCSPNTWIALFRWSNLYLSLVFKAHDSSSSYKTSQSRLSRGTALCLSPTRMLASQISFLRLPTSSSLSCNLSAFHLFYLS